MNDAAYEHHGRPCTRADFYALACDPRRSAAVEACAGAGKTWILVSRMVRALLDGAEPHEILAITFTKKAAGEMRARLREWLADFSQARPGETPAQWDDRLGAELRNRGITGAISPGLLERLRGLYARLLAAPRPMQIRTFHSWFAALVGGAPLAVLQELGLPLEHELLEAPDEAIAAVWRPFLAAVDADAELRADYLALVDEVGRTQLQRALDAAVRRGTEFLFAERAGHVAGAVAAFDAVALGLPAGAEPEEALQGDIARQRWLVRAKALGAEKNKMPQKAAAAAIDAFEQQDLRARLDILRAAFFVKEEDRLTNHLKKFTAAQEAEGELQRVLAACRQHAAWRYHRRLTRLARALLRCFAELKRARGWVDMDDVERTAFTLLADHALSAWVQERLDARIRYLLVDEFQDTNPLQWHALRAWLEGYAGAGGGQLAPSVFIVGDRKQSIYRFRRADPRVFDAAQDFIVEALSGERLACDHTRRNAQAVIAVVNAVMDDAQQAHEFEGFRPHTTESQAAGAVLKLPLVARPVHAKPDAEAVPQWRDTLTVPQVEVEESARLLECQQAARWIRARIASGVRPAAIMVLARTRAPLTLLQAELRKLGVAADQPDKEDLALQPPVQDVLALVDVLLSPGHDLALARALRSPLFSLTDADLVQIALAVRARSAAAQIRPSWFDVLPEVVLTAADGAHIQADLRRYRSWLLQRPPHAALQAIYADRDVLARFARAAPPSDRARSLAQLRALLSAALDLQGGRFLTAYHWLHALRRSGWIVAPAATAAAVRLVTVHGAKGLEADIVLLLDAASAVRPKAEPAPVLEWPSAAAEPSRFAFLANRRRPPADWQALAADEEAAAAREELNVLYVAMTRARTQLVLSAFEPFHKMPGSWWERLQAYAQEEPVAAQDAALAELAPAAPQSFQLLRLPPAVPQPVPLAGRVLPDRAPAPVDAQRERAAQVGQAMHWLLERTVHGVADWPADHLEQIGARFALDADDAQRAAEMARRILGGSAAWAWSERVAEAYNEVELAAAGERVRLDRLVREAGADAAATWWVLDYKSAWQPARDPALVAQLQSYRTAVRGLYPGCRVRAAFLSADGSVSELE